ncbi:unnamed protein product [Polarella glacialis]|uniref:Uncharacterized protein n=1 Tax=Polarella glacialis TaxID=89957 RepID=A0A813FDR5_POLGL|nr:unnamed protein product [Polarella glacialis]
MDLQLETLGRATGPRCAEQNQRSAPAELEPWWTASVVIDCESSGQEEDDSEVEFVSAGSWTLTAEEGLLPLHPEHVPLQLRNWEMRADLETVGAIAIRVGQKITATHRSGQATATLAR